MAYSDPIQWIVIVLFAVALVTLAYYLIKAAVKSAIREELPHSEKEGSRPQGSSCLRRNTSASVEAPFELENQVEIFEFVEEGLWAAY